MRHFLDFEKPIAALEGKVEELRHMSSDGSINIADEIAACLATVTAHFQQSVDELDEAEKDKRRAFRAKMSWLHTGHMPQIHSQV